jgi:uncharacterized protein
MQSSRENMKLFVTDLLNEKLSAAYYYHNYEHTLYVMKKAVEIAGHSNCTEKEIDLLIAAALWHDTGFINTYSNHEKESCMLARLYLPGFGYADTDINIVCAMIMATKMPQSPQNRFEAIIADADLEYLGSVSVEEKANNLFRELQARNPSLTKAQWLKMQVSFLQAHRYFTPFCKENTEPGKKAYLEKLLK